MIRAVIFDWGGTTVDFGCCAPVQAFRETFLQEGIELSERDIRGPMGLHKRDHIRHLLSLPEVISPSGGRKPPDSSNNETLKSGATGSASAATGSLGRGPNATALEETGGSRHPLASALSEPVAPEFAVAESEVDRLYHSYQLLQQKFVARVDLVPGLLPVFDELRGLGLKIGSTTGYPRAIAEPLSHRAREQGFWPDCLVCADDVPAGRPAPWMMFRNMELLETFPPWEVLKVGDTLPDLGEARNAGSPCVLVVDSSSEIGKTSAEWAQISDRDAHRAPIQKLFSQADRVINTLAELPNLIRTWDQTNTV